MAICMHEVQKTSYVINFWELPKVQHEMILVFSLYVIARCHIVLECF